MKKTFETSAIAFAAVLALATPFASAYAGCGVCPQCDPSDNDEKEATRTIDKVNARIDEMEEKLVETLKLHAAQTTGAIEKVGPEVAAAIDGQVRAQKEMKQEEYQAEAIKEHTPSKSGCGNTSTANAFVEASAGTKQAAQDIFTKSNKRTSNTGWVAGGGAPTSKPGEPVGAADDIVQRFDELQKYRNTKEDVNPIKALLDNKTIGTNILVDRTGVTATNPTSTIPTEAENYTEFVNNAVAPIKPDPAPAALTDPAKADFAGKLVYNRQRSNETRTEIAKLPFIKMGALRSPSVDLDKIGDESIQSFFQTQSGTAGTIPEISENDIEDNKISEYFLLDLVMNKKYQSPKWHAELWKDGSENVQRQMAQMMAFSLMLQWRQYQLLEQLSVVIATKLSLDMELAGGDLKAEGLPTQ